MPEKLFAARDGVRRIHTCKAGLSTSKSTLLVSARQSRCLMDRLGGREGRMRRDAICRRESAYMENKLNAELAFTALVGAGQHGEDLPGPAQQRATRQDALRGAVTWGYFDRMVQAPLSGSHRNVKVNTNSVYSWYRASIYPHKNNNPIREIRSPTL